MTFKSMLIASAAVTLGVSAAATPAEAANIRIMVDALNTTIFGNDFEFFLTANGQNINTNRSGTALTVARGTTINFSGQLIDRSDVVARTQTLFVLPSADAATAVGRLTFSNSSSTGGSYTISGVFEDFGNFTLPANARTVAPGNSLSFNTAYSENILTVSAVPEPATWAMMVAGFSGIGLAMRRRKGKVATKVAFV